MIPLYLLGGGDNEAGYVRTWWRFICAATQTRAQSREGDDAADNVLRRIAIVIVPGPDDERARLEERYREPLEFFEPVRKEHCHVLFASCREPLTAERLAEVQPTGVFVAGGLTPLYHEALCADRSWLDYMQRHRLPFAGYSAGAALASGRAILGGWLLGLLHADAEVAPEAAGEGLDFVELRDGLGLFPLPVEAHATQWGTLARLVQLTAEGAVPGGWAIDESCMLEILGDELRVHGANCAYRVRRVADGNARVDVFRAGAILQRADW